MNYRIQYDNTISGAHSGNDSVTVGCYNDYATGYTYKPEDQAHSGNGR